MLCVKVVWCVCVRVAQPRDEAHCVNLLLRAVWSHVYEQGGGVRCFVSTAASTFPERPFVDLHCVLGNGGNEFEPTDAVLAAHYNERGRVESNVVLDGFCDVYVRL